jgi:hypothetical protein
MTRAIEKILQRAKGGNQRTVNQNHDLLDTTLMEIGRQYKPGLIRWLRTHPDRWRQLLALESRINEVVLSKEDGSTLKDALSDYRSFFEEMVKQYVEGDPLPLGGDLREGRST